MPLSIASYLKRAAGPLFRVPSADGAAGEALLTDGDGNLEFGSPVPAVHDHDDLYQPLDAELTAIAGLTSAANKLPYFSGSGLATLTDLSAAGRALLDDADAAAQRSTLGLGTAATQNTTAFDAAGVATTAVSGHEAASDPHPQYLTSTEGNAAFQPLDAELTAIAGLTSAANKLPYFSGAGAASLTDLSAAGRALMDDADAAAQRTTLGLGSAAVEAASAFQPADTQLTDLAALTYSGNALKALRVNAAANGMEFASISSGAAELDIQAQSSTYTLQATDLGDLIDFDTAGQTLNLLAAATAGDKFFCWVRYRGADTGVLTVDGNASETIDGLATITMYAGELRLLICDGSNWQTLLAGGGFARFSSSGSFIVPSRVRGCRVQVIGGGGGGGGGQGAGSGALRTGGGGGGGGAQHDAMIAPSDLGSAGATITVTIAAQTSAAGSAANGSAGGTSSFGALVTAYGGGGGRAGSNEAISGGGGGGVGSVGSNGSNGNVSGGQPVTGSNTVGIGGAGAGTSAGGTARHAEHGGAAGGNTTAAAASTSGGRSIRGGGGGGGGGGCTAANAETAGSDGGVTGDISAAQVGGGGAGGATNGGAASSGTAGTNGFCGSGGGGGGGQDSGTGGAAGDGGAPGGGGGGGGGGTSTGGAGGRGARGECRVWFW